MTGPTASTDPSIGPAAVDLTDPQLYTDGLPHAVFARLRREDPIHRHPYPGGDFWAVTRYADLVTVTRDWRTYSSAHRMVNLWDLSEPAMAARRSIIETDPPAHARLRKLAMPPFTSRRVLDYQQDTRRIIRELVGAALSAGRDGRPIDLVQAISAPLPIRVIVSILGLPAQDTAYLVELSDHLVEGTDEAAVLAADAYGNSTPLDLLPFNSPAAHALFEYGRQIGEQRRARPTGDLVSTLVQAELDGDRLTEVEYANFFQVLVFAGNETTRTAISNGLLAFMDHPDQWAVLRQRPDLVENAVEEVIRWATPVLHFRRTAMADTLLGDPEHGGRQIAAGDKVVIWHASANFDETVFDHPLDFRVDRPIKPKHVAFGAQGPHHCLGAGLARLEIRILLEELLAAGVEFHRTGDVLRARSNFVNGIVRLPARITGPGQPLPSRSFAPV
jgi:cytochrome P450